MIVFRAIVVLLRAAAAVAELLALPEDALITPSCGLGCACERDGLITRFPAYWIVATGGKFQVVSDRGELVEEFDEHEDARWLRDELERATQGRVA